MTKIKICGITSENEIKFLNDLEVDYLGFVFTESKRRISIKEFNSMEKELDKSIKRVGVFRNNTIGDIYEVMNQCNIDIIQLHGDENSNFIKEVGKLGFEIWKGTYIAPGGILEVPSKVSKIVLDSINPGSGVCFEWGKARKVYINKPIFLAGGLNGENILDGLKFFNPYGIDVSSGVESTAPNGVRQKDCEKVIDLIKKVRKYDEGEV